MKANYLCTVGSGTCKYYLDGSNNNFLSAPCECALDNNPGYCPYPGQPETLTYVKYQKLVNENDHCHTLDRENMKAQLECGLRDCEDFRIATQKKMQFENWSSMNGDYVFNCIEEFHPNSYTNIKL